MTSVSWDIMSPESWRYTKISWNVIISVISCYFGHGKLHKSTKHNSTSGIQRSRNSARARVWEPSVGFAVGFQPFGRLSARTGNLEDLMSQQASDQQIIATSKMCALNHVLTIFFGAELAKHHQKTNGCSMDPVISPRGNLKVSKVTFTSSQKGVFQLSTKHFLTFLPLNKVRGSALRLIIRHHVTAIQQNKTYQNMSSKKRYVVDSKWPNDREIAPDFGQVAVLASSGAVPPNRAEFLTAAIHHQFAFLNIEMDSSVENEGHGKKI